jgi:hypothetical protein
LRVFGTHAGMTIQVGRLGCTRDTPAPYSFEERFKSYAFQPRAYVEMELDIMDLGRSFDIRPHKSAHLIRLQQVDLRQCGS